MPETVRTTIGLKEAVTAGSSTSDYRIAVTTELGQVVMPQAVANNLGPGVRVYIVELPNRQTVVVEHGSIQTTFEFICSKFIVT